MGMSSDSTKLVFITTESLHSLGTRSVNSVTSLINSPHSDPSRWKRTMLPTCTFPLEEHVETKQHWLHLQSYSINSEKNSPTHYKCRGKQVPTYKHPSLIQGPPPLQCMFLPFQNRRNYPGQGYKVKHVKGHTHRAQCCSSMPALTACSEWQPLVQHFLNPAHLESSQWIRIPYYRLGTFKLFSLHLGNLEKQS